MIRAALTFGCLAVALLCGPGAARADSLQEIFERSNAAYFRADYDQASEGYLELVELGVLDPDVSYNLATSEARRGRFGSAIRYFERTLWLRPGDDDAREGLAAARSAVGRRRADRQGMAQIDSAPPLAEALFGGVSREVFAVTTLAAEVVLCGALLGLLFVRRENHRLALGITAPLALGVVLASGTGMVVSQGWLEEGEPAVVLRERVPLREGPDAGADERHFAAEGQRAWVLAEEGDWVRIRVPDVGEGWAVTGQIGRVRP